MQELIKIETAEIKGAKQQTVNARALYEFLGVKSDFKNWIKNRIEDFGFVENQDYVSFGKNLPKPQGGRPSREYFVSISMAKELAMVERNGKGKAARLYFIECERIAKEKATAPALPDYPTALRQLAASLEKQAALEAQAAKDAPQIAFAKGIQATAKEEPITGAAKILGIKPKTFFDWLRLNGFIYKQSTQATAKSIDAGLMVVRFAAINHADEVERKAYAHVTGKGLYYFYAKLRNSGLVSRNDNLELAV